MAGPGKPGQPKWIPDAAILVKVEELASRGLNKEQIAYCLGIAPQTVSVKQHEYPEFAEALKRGAAKGLHQVANALFENAMKGNVTAQIYFMKARGKADWMDGSQTQYANEDERQAKMKLRKEKARSWKLEKK